MKRFMRGSLLTVLLIVIAAPVDLMAGRRVVVRRGHVVRTTVVVRPGHPLRRALPAVVVRPARVAVAVTAPLVFLPLVAWHPAVVTLPPRERLLWQDAETIAKDEDWVDCNFGVDRRGDALLLEIQGRAQVNFAEVTFENGNVQVVDFAENTRGSGIYPLLDFADGRRVKTVRIVARAKSNEAKLTVYMRA
jgi:hypothetical protein